MAFSLAFFQLFQGNSERYFVVVHRLRPAVRARYIRINPKSWYGWIAMRLELFGCRLGMYHEPWNHEDSSQTELR